MGYEELGYKEIRPGVYLYKAEALIEEQEQWCEEDECKWFDFTQADYWLVDDAGSDPVAVETNWAESKIKEKN